MTSEQFNEIPRQRPDTPLLDQIADPADLRQLNAEQLPELARQLRHYLLYTVGQTGGHFGAGLGVVELTLAIHYVFDTPEDRLIWDVGHQTYPHKIITGRREQMSRLRRPDGLAPFPSRDESLYDVFGTGHSSTSISAALGMELAADLSNTQHNTVVVIGDGAMTAGMAFEALNHMAACRADVIVILNDNAMSISENVGGLANYFARNISAVAVDGDDNTAEPAVPGSIFRDLGFAYSGPIDGHDLSALTDELTRLKSGSGPRLLHALTRKGKGYGPAEAAPVDSHALTKLEKQPETAGSNESPRSSYSQVFGHWAAQTAAHDNRLVMITPAMKQGSGLQFFAKQFPDRFHDVAIAEQHAVTFAAGLAVGGVKPVVAIYSTFLQRAFDQLIHDVAIQNLDVLFAVDRASLLEDGPTHSGVFDLSFCRSIPNLMIMAASSEASLNSMLKLGYEHPGPCLVRYPRGQAGSMTSGQPLQPGRARVVREGSRVSILSFGALLETADEVAAAQGFTLVDMQFIKPLDTDLIRELAASHSLLVTLEENAIAGGAGSAVNEFLAAAGLVKPILNLGVPDNFVDQDDPSAMLEKAGLSAEKIAAAIQERLEKS